MSTFYQSPAEAWAEAGARLMFPPSNDVSRKNFERIFSNVMMFVKGKLVAEKIIPAPRVKNAITGLNEIVTLADPIYKINVDLVLTPRTTATYTMRGAL
jgi:hypothetical protein